MISKTEAVFKLVEEGRENSLVYAGVILWIGVPMCLGALLTTPIWLPLWAIETFRRIRREG